jgi:hypothetical protein
VTSRYVAYGSLLESDIPLPELPAAPAAGAPPRWRIVRDGALPPMQAAKELGREPIYADVAAILTGHRDGLRISVGDTGSFDLGAEGVIRAQPLETASEAFVRAHLLGRVLPTALHHEGWMPLHASAVLTREGVVAFLGPKGLGKSTLAAAMVDAGAHLVSDDVVPVEPSQPPRAWPGLQTLRLRADVRETLALDDAAAVPHDAQRAALPVGAERRSTRPEPLAALFLLAPAADDATEQGAVKIPYAPVLAAAAITAHVKCGAMFGAGAAATMLGRAARLVHAVPVHQLVVPRDLARLPDIAAQLLAWYGGPPR